MALWKARGGDGSPSILSIVDTPTAHQGQRVLVTSFSGFMDAGSAAQVAVNHVLKVSSARTLAAFDSDALLDYRARRPKMIFNGERFTSADWPEITLKEVIDERGTPFLLLSGPEPDYRWREFVAATLWLVREFDVALTAGMIGIPWPAPHTRPIGVTLHGTSKRLLQGHRPMLGTMEIPGHAQAILELQLGEAGRDAMGLAVHVPHYLTQFEYPRAAIALLRGLSGATGLVLNTDGLEEQAVAAEAEIARQTSDSNEFEPLLRSMEEAYDRGEAGGLLNDDPYANDLPDADQIGAQVERFLAEMDDRGGEQV